MSDLGPCDVCRTPAVLGISGVVEEEHFCGYCAAELIELLRLDLQRHVKAVKQAGLKVDDMPWFSEMDLGQQARDAGKVRAIECRVCGVRHELDSNAVPSRCWQCVARGQSEDS